MWQRVLVFWGILVLAPLQGAIYETWNLSPLWDISESLSSDDLVIFDVDHTLILEKDMVLRPCRRKCLRHMLYLKGVHSLKKQNHLISKILQQREVFIIDPGAVALISLLQKQGVKVMALTAMKCGPLGEITDTATFRAQELQQLGFNFSTTFPPHKTLVLHELSHPIASPTFEQGVLCASYSSKGEALALFLKKVDFTPKRVIFVDNNYTFLESVQQAMHQEGIPFVGFYYRGWVLHPGEQDDKITHFQMRHLIDHETWLSDKEAKSQLSSQKEVPSS